jgi:hypothetical protein
MTASGEAFHGRTEEMDGSALSTRTPATCTIPRPRGAGTPERAGFCVSDGTGSRSPAEVALADERHQ